MEGDRPAKVCFVTIGATAAFDCLIKATLHPDFLEALKQLNYMHLRLQYGKNGASILKEASELGEKEQNARQSLSVTGFDFKKDGLQSEMLAARDGVVISHAGTIYALCDYIHDD